MDEHVQALHNTERVLHHRGAGVEEYRQSLVDDDLVVATQQHPPQAVQVHEQAHLVHDAGAVLVVDDLGSEVRL